MTQILKQSTAVDVLIGPFVDLTDGATAEAGESPSVELSKNGQTLAAKSDATTPAYDDLGYYNCELDATDTNTVGTMILAVAATASALPVRHEFQVLEEAVYDRMYASGAFDTALYIGPRGPGVYLNDGAGNETTVNGIDGIINNPVSTIAAAKSLADSMSLDRIYLVNDSPITLAATMTDYEFVGIGAPSGNVITFGSQDVSNSSFYNVAVTGTQGGSGRILIEDGIIDDCTDLHVMARRCGLIATTGIDFSNNDDNVIEGCFSMVAGNAAPKLDVSQANLDLSIRHYSGGIEFTASHSTATVSLETDGQCIFGSGCTVTTVFTLRGNMTITDNTAGMSSLTVDAALSRSEIADALLDRDMSTGTDSGSATVRTVRQALRFLRNKWSISSTTLTVTKENDSSASWTAELTTDASADPVTAFDPPDS